MKQGLLLLLFLTFGISMAQPTTAKAAWLEKWENSKNYLIAIAEVMPDSLYDFKPTERQMTFKAQLVHIKSNMDWLSTTYFTNLTFDRTKVEIPATKEATILLIEEAFDAAAEIIAETPDASLIETVDFFAGNKSKLQILNLLQDHVSHHRGQLIVYLNLNNVKPPPFSGW